MWSWRSPDESSQSTSNCSLIPSGRLFLVYCSSCLFFLRGNGLTFVPSVTLNNRWFAAVIDAHVSRKVGRDIINKQITSRRDPRSFLMGIMFSPLS